MPDAPPFVHRALQNGEFVPYFQPLVDLRTGALRGFELLARWLHPERGVVPPVEFIGLAERDGWIDLLSEEILRQAFEYAKSLRQDFRFSVNLSPIQLHSRSLPARLEALASGAGFPLHRLWIEVTESALVTDHACAVEVAHDLKALGCRLALDDFGTGYSSLQHLQALPFDALKVDRSFVNTMTTSRESRKIVAAIVGLGQGLRIRTIAEGVETEEQDEILLWLGCDRGQGWLYGHPLPGDHLAEVIAQKRARSAPRRATEGADRRSVSQYDLLPSVRLAQLRAVYDSAQVGLAFLDHDLRYLTVNKRLAEINGIPMAEHLGRSIAEVLPGAFPYLEADIRRALSGVSVEHTKIQNLPLRGERQRAFWVSYEPARDEGGEVAGVSIAVLDVTGFTASNRA